MEEDLHPERMGGGTPGSNWGTKTIDLDSSMGWNDAQFNSPTALRATINKGDDGRYDILDMRGDEYSGSILFTDSYGSDGMAYEVSWNKDYTSSARGPKGIRVKSFRELEEGEW